MTSSRLSSKVNRRQAFIGLGAGLGSASLISNSLAGLHQIAYGSTTPSNSMTSHQPLFVPQDWESVRDQFVLDRSWVHMAGLLFASHPAPVRLAIDDLKAQFDANPVATVHSHLPLFEDQAREAVAKYFGVESRDIALTDSTTMGLALLYHGLKLLPGDEVLTTEHDHYSTHESLRLACARRGAHLRKIKFYNQGPDLSVQRAKEVLAESISPKTRVVAVTWVHSATGVKLPIFELAKVVAKANLERPANSRILLCVDGVHGTGVENIRLSDLGCDFFAAGTHKWLFGPRGTGMLWGRPEVQDRVEPTIPSFSAFKKGDTASWGQRMTPGGFHTYEYRWAVSAATNFHLAIGKARVEERIHGLATLAKEGLRRIKGVNLHTPMSPELSSGIICFEVEGLTPKEVVEKLEKRRIIASTTPYAVSYARITPSLLNHSTDVENTLKAIAAISQEIHGA